MSDVLRIDRNGSLLRLTMQRPEKRNALNSELVEALIETLENAEADKDVRVVLLAAKTKPVIAVVDGPALGGGAALAIACDMVIASHEAKFGYPEIKRGFTVAGVLPLLVKHIGEKAVFDLYSTCIRPGVA